MQVFSLVLLAAIGTQVSAQDCASITKGGDCKQTSGCDWIQGNCLSVVPPPPTTSPTGFPTSSPTNVPTSGPTTSPPTTSPTMNLPTSSPVLTTLPPTTHTPTFVPSAIPMTMSPTTLTAPAPAVAWINEFHYDNDGTDTGEFIEVAYTSGIDITTYTIVLYNGNGGGTYDTVAVPTGSSTTQDILLSIIDFPSNGLQNGSPDGIALIDAAGGVVEFLSYEGTLTATDGPASGQASTNIGVSETGTTPVGFSLQRSGSGCAGSDFSWNSPAAQTKGSINIGQSITCGPAPPSPPPTLFPTLRPTITKAPVAPVSNVGVKLMTYNIEQGGTLTTTWKDIVKAENADILVFTETGNWDDDNDALLNQYLDEFNAYFSSATPYVSNTVQGIGIANSANAILTRFPIVQFWQLTDQELSSDSAHDLMVWKLDVGGGEFIFVIGIHLKCCGGATNDSRRNNTMRNLIAWIDANTNVSDGVILMGDFNAVSPIDTDPSFPGYQSGFEPSAGSSLNDGPLRMLLDVNDPDSSSKHTFVDTFRTANPTCGSNADCCADTLCDGGLSAACPERGYSYVGSTHDFDSRIDFIMVNQNVAVSGDATVGDLTGNTVCTASDHLPVDVIVSF